MLIYKIYFNLLFGYIGFFVFGISGISDMGIGGVFSGALRALYRPSPDFRRKFERTKQKPPPTNRDQRRPPKTQSREVSVGGGGRGEP